MYAIRFPSALLFAAILLCVATVGAQDLPPGSGGKDVKAGMPPAIDKLDKAGKLNISADLLSIKKSREATSPELVKHTDTRFVAFIEGEHLGDGWLTRSEKVAKKLRPKDVAAAEKAKVPYVKEIKGITLVAHDSLDSFTHCVFNVVDHKGQTKILNVPLRKSTKLANATALFLLNSEDNAEMLEAFDAAVGVR